MDAKAPCLVIPWIAVASKKYHLSRCRNDNSSEDNNMSDKQNIVFVADRNYLRLLAAALASLLENNSDMNIYVIHSELRKDDWKILENICMRNNSCLINARIDDKSIRNLASQSFTKTTYYKLFISDVVKGDKTLYLDPDILVLGEIDDLYDTDISNTFLAAVDNLETPHYYQASGSCSGKYFNAGVMLINLKHWRTHDIKGKVVKYVCSNAEKIRFADQDGLNYIINGQWRELHPRYNVHTGILSSKYNDAREIKEAVNNPAIIHFTGFHKPDQFCCDHPYAHLYREYLRKTPYKYALPSKPSNILKAILPESIKGYLKKAVRA